VLVFTFGARKNPNKPLSFNRDNLFVGAALAAIIVAKAAPSPSLPRL